jgi:hypothetical protein
MFIVILIYPTFYLEFTLTFAYSTCHDFSSFNSLTIQLSQVLIFFAWLRALINVLIFFFNISNSFPITVIKAFL